MRTEKSPERRQTACCGARRVATLFAQKPEKVGFYRLYKVAAVAAQELGQRAQVGAVSTQGVVANAILSPQAVEKAVYQRVAIHVQPGIGGFRDNCVAHGPLAELIGAR